jgi:RND family efflux transporter MFP subunit
MLLVLFDQGCETNGTSATTTPMPPAASQPEAVRVVPVERRAFSLILLSNGLLRAPSQSRLSFKTGGILSNVFVQNGTAVRAGQVLATLDNRDQQMALRQAQDGMDDARNALGDLTLHYTGQDGDTSRLKPQVLTFLKYKSGYNKAVTALEKARLELDYTTLRAPFAGVVANLSAKPHNLIGATEPFCTLLDRSGLLVEFSVLETELPALRLGAPVRIEPIALPGAGYAGRVVELNPVVDKQGLVMVKARLDRPDARLFEGMNARVRVERRVADQLVAPKTALVERSGRKVIFTYENGRARWHYVTVLYENETEVALSGGELKAGDEAIVSGNLNLGHDAPVRVDKSPRRP